MDLRRASTLLIKHEGLKLKLYPDTVGKQTIGVGHNIQDNGISTPIAMAILSEDLTDTINYLNNTCPWFQSLDDVRQLAIVDLVFDIRTEIQQFKHMIAAIEAQDWVTASNELLNSLFAKQAPNRAKDLAQMILTGQDNA